MASLVEITIAHGIDEYRVTRNGNWTMLIKGMKSEGSPYFTWKPIPKHRVPPFVVIKSEGVFKYA